jgi:putative spermidine/putrescine transport system substrate-binding protein
MRATLPPGHRLPSRRFSARIAALTAIAVLIGVSACSSSGSPSAAPAATGTSASSGTVPVDPDLSGQQLTWVSNGGPFQTLAYNDLVKPFATKTGLKVLQDDPVDYAKVQAQVQSGDVSWDIVNTGAPYNVADCGTLFAKTPDIDRSLIPKKYQLDDCSVPVGIASIVLVYNTKLFKNDPPTSWADFFNTTKYPGKRGLWASLNTAPFEIAELADGVKPANLYPINFSQALAKWATIKSDLSTYTSLAASTEQLQSQAVSMAAIEVTRAVPAVLQGAPYAAVWNQNIIALATYEIVKGSTHLAAAESLLQYMATAAPQEALAKDEYLGPVVEGATLPTNPVIRSWNAALPAHQAAGVVQNQSWWAQGSNLTTGTTQWTDFLSG